VFSVGARSVSQNIRFWQLQRRSSGHGCTEGSCEIRGSRRSQSSQFGQEQAWHTHTDGNYEVTTEEPACDIEACQISDTTYPYTALLFNLRLSALLSYPLATRLRPSPFVQLPARIPPASIHLAEAAAARRRRHRLLATT